MSHFPHPDGTANERKEAAERNLHLSLEAYLEAPTRDNFEAVLMGLWPYQNAWIEVAKEEKENP